MSIHDILKPSLEKLGIDSINCGGCGFFAIKLFDVLDKLGFKANVVMYTCDEELVEAANENNLSDYIKNNHGGCSHVVLEVDSALYDGEGLVHEDQWKHYDEVVISSEDLRYMVYNWRRWNSDFDREEETPKIEAFLGKLERKIRRNKKLLLCQC